MSLAEKLRAREADLKKKVGELKDVAESKGQRLREKADAKRREDDRIRALKAQAGSEEEYQAELFKASELIRKTKDYFEIGVNGQRVLIPPNFPSYFGEHKAGEGGSWVPHGPGQFLHKHQVVLEGNFRDGVIHGAGIMRLEDGRQWEGEFKKGKAHGVGFVVTQVGEISSRREALARDHIVICYKDELQEGIQVEINDPTMRVSAQLGYCGKVSISLMKHVKDWKWTCRFHEDVKPRERDVIFSSLRTFRVLHHLPQIYHLSRFGYDVDPEPRYNYFKDVYGADAPEPKLGIAGGRRTAEMRPYKAAPLQPYARTNKSNYRENSYESHMVGIGAAEEEEAVERKKELKKQQFMALIEKRRADAEDERQRAIEEEQARITAEDLARNKAKAAEREAEKRSQQAALKAAMEETAAKFDAEH